MILASVLIFNTTGILVVFKVRQTRIRQEVKMLIKNGIAQDKLHHFIFRLPDVNNIDWVREGKEFRHGNSMFDIVRSVTTNGEIHFYCVNDVEERILFQDLENLIEQKMHDDSGNNMKGKIAKLIKSFEVIVSHRQPCHDYHASEPIFFRYGQNSYTPVVLEPESPPPQFA